MAVICPGCRKSVEAVDAVEKCIKTKKEWRIFRCPREDCRFNIDIEPASVKREAVSKGRYFWRDGEWR